MLTEGGTMSTVEHYQISVSDPRALAGGECCKWHQRMKRRDQVKKDTFAYHPKYKRVRIGHPDDGTDPIKKNP